MIGEPTTVRMGITVSLPIETVLDVPPAQDTPKVILRVREIDYENKVVTFVIDGEH
jgi:hypothetical protein